jgi:hypothetical protein
MDTPLEHLITALRAAAAAKEEQPLLRAPKQNGLFTARTGPAGEALQTALRSGLVEITRKETKGKTETEWAKITPRGVQFLAQHESPREVMLQLVEVLKTHSNGLPRWLTDLQGQVQSMNRRLQEFLDQFTAELQQLSFRVQEALKRSEATPMVPPALLETLAPWQLDLLEHLRLFEAATTGPCPLNVLFPELKSKHPDLGVPAFHEGILGLRDRGIVALVPWTGTLNGLAEPEFALLEDGTVYASVRRRT